MVFWGEGVRGKTFISIYIIVIYIYWIGIGALFDLLSFLGE
jgi:hypothetical protein